ncbi:MAG: peptidoglycan DD-metalloendopeptidase family protein [Eubacteriales bacterium]|nr:peptidoglycan DD-metalloendopeptidase family protein [Eubacteriales bacterium]
MLKKILCIVITAILVLSSTYAVVADTLSELQSEQSRLDQEAQEYQALIDSLQDDIDKQQEYVDAVAAKVAVANEDVALSRSKISEYETKISEKTSEIEALQDEADENMDLFRQRLRAIYMSGDVTAIEIILGASDFNDVVDKLQLLSSMNRKDSELIDDIEVQMDGINEEVELLSADKEALEVEHEALEEKQTELNSLLEKHESELATLFGQQDEAAVMLDSIEASQSENEQKIQDYYASLEKPDNGSSNGDSGGVTPPAGGGWVWPVPAHHYITSYYCEDRGSYYHGGIDIAGSGFMGCTVVAAASGTVIDSYNYCSHNWGKYGSCGCNGGWGNYVWIDHGNGKATIYAHLTSASVYAGQSVSAGQVIGYGGSTGYSTGPHLHFEARYYGTKYNPLDEY